MQRVFLLLLVIIYRFNHEGPLNENQEKKILSCYMFMCSVGAYNGIYFIHKTPKLLLH